MQYAMPGLANHSYYVACPCALKKKIEAINVDLYDIPKDYNLPERYGVWVVCPSFFYCSPSSMKSSILAHFEINNLIMTCPR